VTVPCENVYRCRQTASTPLFPRTVIRQCERCGHYWVPVGFKTEHQLRGRLPPGFVVWDRFEALTVKAERLGQRWMTAKEPAADAEDIPRAAKDLADRWRQPRLWSAMTKAMKQAMAGSQ